LVSLYTIGSKRQIKYILEKKTKQIFIKQKLKSNKYFLLKK